MAAPSHKCSGIFTVHRRVPLAQGRKPKALRAVCRMPTPLGPLSVRTFMMAAALCDAQADIRGKD